MNENRRAPTDRTSRELKDLVPAFLEKIAASQEMRIDLILAAWQEIIGPKLAPMTQAVSFEGGVLNVKVRNATLYSLLSQHEKGRLMAALREKFPKVEIRNINFRVG